MKGVFVCIQLEFAVMVSALGVQLAAVEGQNRVGSVETWLFSSSFCLLNL